jgi:hypothetical protein
MEAIADMGNYSWLVAIGVAAILYVLYTHYLRERFLEETSNRAVLETVLNRLSPMEREVYQRLVERGNIDISDRGYSFNQIGLSSNEKEIMDKFVDLFKSNQPGFSGERYRVKLAKKRELSDRIENLVGNMPEEWRSMWNNLREKRLSVEIDTDFGNVTLRRVTGYCLTPDEIGMVRGLQQKIAKLITDVYQGSYQEDEAYKLVHILVGPKIPPPCHKTLSEDAGQVVMRRTKPETSMMMRQLITDNKVSFAYQPLPGQFLRITGDLSPEQRAAVEEINNAHADIFAKFMKKNEPYLGANLSPPRMAPPPMREQLPTDLDMDSPSGEVKPRRVIDPDRLPRKNGLKGYEPPRIDPDRLPRKNGLKGYEPPRIDPDRLPRKNGLKGSEPLRIDPDRLPRKNAGNGQSGLSPEESEVSRKMAADFEKLVESGRVKVDPSNRRQPIRPVAALSRHEQNVVALASRIFGILSDEDQAPGSQREYMGLGEFLRHLKRPAEKELR